MTDSAIALAPGIPRSRNRRAPGTLKRTATTLARGLIGGALLGIVARAWMRVIAEDPEFTWGGTLFIVIGFTIFGFTQSIVVAVRHTWPRGWRVTIARVVGVIGLLPLFLGAGSLMMATVVSGGLAVARVDWSRSLRSVCLVVAAAPVFFVAKGLVVEFGWSLRAAVGFVGLVAIYGAIVAAARFTFAPQTDRWHLNRGVRFAIVVVVGLLQLRLLVGLDSF